MFCFIVSIFCVNCVRAASRFSWSFCNTGYAIEKIVNMNAPSTVLTANSANFGLLSTLSLKFSYFVFILFNMFCLFLVFCLVGN